MTRLSRRCAAIVASLVLGGTASATEPVLGTVSFPNSGAPAAQEDFIRGVLYLHSFEYGTAAAAFRRAQSIDPDFAMAYWGEAMTRHHSLWRNQDTEGAQAILRRLGATAEERAGKAQTAREQGYLHAVESLFGMTPDTAQMPKLERDVYYRDTMRKLHETYPEDLEARAFYGLSILGVGSVAREFATYMKAAAVVTPVWEANRTHPGAAHYLIHAYDDPIHAVLGLPMARAYGEIATDASHAQHMVSHIYMALGMWDETAAANVIAMEVEARNANDDFSRPSWHYRYWLHYGRLQQGRLAEARAILKTARKRLNNPEPNAAEVAYYGAMVARYLIDTELWAEAADWDMPANVPATTQYAFAQALAASNQGNLQQAREWLAMLKPADEGSRELQLGDQEIEILRLQATGVLAAAEGKPAVALQHAQKAAAIQASIPYQYGPPRIPKPTGELVGDLLLAQAQYAQAAAAYEGQLSLSQLRTNSLLGLAKASAALDDERKTQDATAALSAIWHQADPGSPMATALQQFPQPAVAANQTAGAAKGR